MRNPPEQTNRPENLEATELLAHPDRLVSLVKSMRADGDFRGAAAILREALHQDPDNSEIRGLLAQTQLDLRFCDEKRAWLVLLAETRDLVKGHVETGDLSEAQSVLQDVERRHGPIEELEDLKDRLRVLNREREVANARSHLLEAQRLRDQGDLQGSVWEARQAMAFDRQNREAKMLADALILEIEEQELESAVRRDATRIAALLRRGRLIRAGLLIRNSRRKFGNIPALQSQLQRRRRLRTTRWAGRRARLQSLGRAIPVDKIRALPGQLNASGKQAIVDWWARVSHLAGAPWRWIHGQREERRRTRMRELISQVRVGRRARVDLETETRARIEDLVELGELGEAQTFLTRVESEQGVLHELEDWRNYLHLACREQLGIEVASHLSEAERLRDEGQLRESLREARQALALDSQNSDAKTLEADLSSQLEGQELAVASRRDGARIDDLLAEGRLVQAGNLIRICRKRYGDSLDLEGRERRYRRLQAVRWANRRAAVEDLGRAIPTDRIKNLPGSVYGSLRQQAIRGWSSVGHLVGELGTHILPLFEKRDQRRAPALVASITLVIAATIGVYYLQVRVQKGPDSPLEEQVSDLAADPATTTVPSGDLILDALPWGRVVAIVDQEGEQQSVEEELFTPVRRSLPVGSYRVVLENPAVEKPAEFWVQIFPSGVTTKVHEFQPFDADDYFGKAWY